MLNDLRYAWRALGRSPAFSVTAILTLALGIGANSAIFSVINAVLLRPLTYPEPDRIVWLANRFVATGNTGQVSAPDFHDWHDRTTSFSAMAYHLGGETSVIIDGTAEYARAIRVTPEFFMVFETPAEIGRVLSREEFDGTGPTAVVVSYDFWQRRLGGGADALGRTISFGQRTFTVVGVMPPRFRFPEKTDIWSAAWIFPETTSRSAHNYRVVARLKDGVSLGQAQAELAALASQLEQQYPTSNRNKSAVVQPLHEALVGSTRSTLYLLLGAVALVLLIACANVSNLLLARATVRTSELAVRAALGAGRGRIVRQLVTESLLLAVVAGAVGLLFAAWGIRALVALAPAGLPYASDIAVDRYVLAFTLAASAIASLAFGVLPAFQASRLDLNETLRRGGRGGLGAGGARLRNVLVVAEIALAVMLVTGAALLIRSFVALQSVAMGFHTDRLLVAETAVPARDLDGARRAAAFYTSLRPQLAAIPGVLSVAGVTSLPTRMRSNGGYWIEGGPGPEQQGIQSPQAVFNVVTPAYFQTMGIPILAGRDFTDRDLYDAPLVAIVNRALVKQSFPDKDPIGTRIRCGLDRPEEMTIVAIVDDVRTRDPSLPPMPEIYMPAEQHPRPATALNLVARTSGDPLGIAGRLQEVVRKSSPEVPVRIGTMRSALATAVSAPRFRTVLVGVFAALALCLALAGVYGVMAYAVGRRIPEIGVRMALGAAPRDILQLVLGQGLRLATVGIMIGWTLAIASSRILSRMLFGVAATDPIVFALVPALLLVSTIVACSAPALRAARTDPMHALREP